MDSKLEKVTDSNALANAIMKDIADVEKLERLYELSSADLFRIDCAILSSLRNTQDFSRDLLNQLESGKFEEIVQKPPQIDIMKQIQTNTIIDVALNELFGDMTEKVTEEFFRSSV